MTNHKVIPWYRKRYTGWKLETIWQITIGSMTMLSVVLVPLYMDYTFNKQLKKHSFANGSQTSDFQKMVYEEGLKIRKLIQEDKEREMKEQSKA